jgi:hypothetical protein
VSITNETDMIKINLGLIKKRLPLLYDVGHEDGVKNKPRHCIEKSKVYWDLFKMIEETEEML